MGIADCLLRHSLVGKSVSNTGWRVGSFLQLCSEKPERGYLTPRPARVTGDYFVNYFFTFTASFKPLVLAISYAFSALIWK